MGQIFVLFHSFEDQLLQDFFFFIFVKLGRFQCMRSVYKEHLVYQESSPKYPMRILLTRIVGPFRISTVRSVYTWSISRVRIGHQENLLCFIGVYVKSTLTIYKCTKRIKLRHISANFIFTKTKKSQMRLNCIEICLFRLILKFRIKIFTSQFGRFAN